MQRLSFIKVNSLVMIVTLMQVAAASILGPEALELSSRAAGDIFSVSDDEEDQGASVSLTAEKKDRLERLNKLIQELPVRQAQKFDPLLILPGLESWLKYLKEKVSGCEGKAEEDSCYEGWYKKHILTEQPLECDVQFSRIFQNLQTRSTTEAIAETVGSIMNQHLGKNR